MAKIERVKDLPSWYSLEKYCGCESFTAKDWFFSLSIRKDILGFARFLDTTPFRFPETLERNQWYAADLTALREAPLNYHAGTLLWEMPQYQREVASPPVRYLSFDELFYQYHADLDAAEHGEADKEFAERWHLITHDDPFGLPQSIEGAVIGNIGGTGQAMLVDLAATDAQLLEAFSLWLNSARKQKAGKPRRPHFDRWARYGLLPYLDLLIWEAETGVHIPDRVKSAAISNYDAGEDNLRKTIVPLAAVLMRNLSELQAAAALEHTASGTN